MKKLLLSAAIIVAGLSATAQKEEAAGSKLKFSVGVEAALPLGDFGTFYSFGIGGSAQADYNVAENFDITLNAGVTSYMGKTISGFKIPAQTVIPILIGGKYGFSGNFYGSVQVGTGIFTAGSGGGGSVSTFAYAPGVGYKFTPNVDVLVKYTGFSKDGASNSALGLRVAYTF